MGGDLRFYDVTIGEMRQENGWTGVSDKHILLNGAFSGIFGDCYEFCQARRGIFCFFLLLKDSGSGFSFPSGSGL